jgi:hypothetical protein
MMDDQLLLKQSDIDVVPISFSAPGSLIRDYALHEHVCYDNARLYLHQARSYSR